MKYRDPNTNTFKNLTVKVSDTLPIGTIVGYAGATAPDGWLICDGSAISRSLYSALFSAIGTTYGAGDESTTFNLPDMNGRVPVGLKVNTEWFASLGQTGGSETHTLTIEEMPSHNHLDTGAGGVEGQSGGGSGWTKFVGTISPYYTENTGGGQPHSILQPYIVTNYIIKAYQPIAVPGKIVNNYSANPDNAYNTTYVNGKYDEVMRIMESAAVGKILWTNPKPTEDFIQQEITLNNSDYETYKIYYKLSKRDNSFLISESIKGNGTKLITKWRSNYIADRDVVYISETKLRFYGAYQNDMLTNDFLIPVYIIGYKTGLLD